MAIKDFYTVVDQDGGLDSTFESLMGEIERPAVPILTRLLSPFEAHPTLSGQELAELSTFAAFQIVRTPRRRREIELQGEWWAKAMASGRVPDEQLRQVSLWPDPNATMSAAMPMAYKLGPVIGFRPLVVVYVDRPGLLIGDEPVVVNAGPDTGHHHPDCFLTDEQIAQRAARTKRKRGRRRSLSRVVHFQSTATQGVGVALEVVMPISPMAALWWGPIAETFPPGPVEVERLVGKESERFIQQMNEITIRQSLTWVVGSTANAEFETVEMPAPGPLLRVCSGDDAATLAVNAVPDRLRPDRVRAGRLPNRRKS